MRLIDADELKESFLNTDAEGINLLIDKYAIKCIDNAPTIEAEPVRRGHWELIDGAEPRYYGCSECKVLSFFPDNYCHNCGAKMEDEKK